MLWSDTNLPTITERSARPFILFGNFRLPEALPEVLPEALPTFRKRPSLLCTNYAE